MQIEFDKISIDSIIQIILIFVFVIQAAYLIRQTNFGIRSSQANLVQKWEKELETIDIKKIIRKKKEDVPSEVEFERLLKIFDRMHPLFRQRLLKPSDFGYMFIAFYNATSSEELRKSKIYQDNYLRLQHIFSDFNKDMDMIDYMLNLPNASAFEQMLMGIYGFKSSSMIRNQAMKNWTKSQKAIKINAIINCKLRRYKLFKLKPPI